MGDLADRADVEHLVRAFYAEALADDLLAPLFRAAGFDLETHLPVMVDFWTTVLLRSGAYRRDPLAPHVALAALTPLTGDHFAAWLALWARTVDALFAGARADAAKTQAVRIGASIRRHLEGGPASEYGAGLPVRTAGSTGGN
jgi:hemoglobin